MKRILSVLVVLAPATVHADKTFNTGKGATWDCAKDKDVTINTSGGTYTLKGACEDIDVNGSRVTLSIASIEDLTINGGKNTVTIGAADDIHVNGNDNVVTWSKALDARKSAPKVTTLGSGNIVKRAGAAGAAAPAPATTATVLDCSKQKNVSISKGKGSYQVTGTCDKVAISGGDNSVTIEAAKNLAITGSRNTVSIGKADKIAAMGANNTVTYGGGLSLAQPKTATIGKGNTITSGAVTAPTAANTGSIAPTSGTIDCGTTASHTIATDDGNYVFTGTCELIVVDGNNNKLRVANAKAISLTGNSNSLDVAAVGMLSTPGNNNSARWKTGLGAAKAKVANAGNGNTIVQAK